MQTAEPASGVLPADPASGARNGAGADDAAVRDPAVSPARNDGSSPPQPPGSAAGGSDASTTVPKPTAAASDAPLAASTPEAGAGSPANAPTPAATTSASAATSVPAPTAGAELNSEGTGRSNGASHNGSSPSAKQENPDDDTLRVPLVPKPSARMAGDASRRRSDRIRQQALRAEENRRIREERAAIEEARSKARSIAAKKAAATKRKAAKAAAAGIELPPAKRAAPAPPAKKIVKLRYASGVAAPQWRRVDLEGVGTPFDLFWLRANLREFLLRFDKLCRLPARFTAGLNDPLQPWTPEQFKPVIVALLKLVASDKRPLHASVRTYLNEIEQLDAASPRIWDWLLEFIEQLDAYAPTETPTTEPEMLELVRRLAVLCTGTETIRITVMTDIDQLKWVEKDVHDEVRQIGAKLKETEQKLAKLKKVDKTVYEEKLAAAQRAAENKSWKAQQQLYTKLHKFTMRTAPVAVDGFGNKYWSLQYKSAMHPEWGSWILAEMVYDPAALAAWPADFGSEISRVLEERDALVAEKNADRKRQREKKKQAKQASADAATAAAPADTERAVADSGAAANDASTPSTSADTASAGTAPKPDPDAAGPATSGAKRRYPKLRIDLPPRLPEPQLYVVEGKANVYQLGRWLAGMRTDAKMVAEINSVANYLAQEE